jgi:hypothetical protein
LKEEEKEEKEEKERRRRWWTGGVCYWMDKYRAAMWIPHGSI